MSPRMNRSTTEAIPSPCFFRISSRRSFLLSFRFGSAVANRVSSEWPVPAPLVPSTRFGLVGEPLSYDPQPYAFVSLSEVVSPRGPPRLVVLGGGFVRALAAEPSVLDPCGLVVGDGQVCAGPPAAGACLGHLVVAHGGSAGESLAGNPGCSGAWFRHTRPTRTRATATPDGCLAGRRRDRRSPR